MHNPLDTVFSHVWYNDRQPFTTIHTVISNSFAF